jgi:multiple sugar transport system permease protein
MRKNMSQPIKTIGKKMFLYFLLLIGLFFTVTPFLYMLSTSLKENIFVFEFPPKFIPSNPTLQNYLTVLTTRQFDRYFMNSVFVTLLTTFSVVLMSSMMAFAFSRFTFKRKKLLSGLIRLFMMMPSMTLIVPQFILTSKMNLLNNLWGVIMVYIAQNLSLSVFLLTGFFKQIPVEIEEAAKIDGASPWQVFARIILPLSTPALATSAIFTSLGAWDEYVWAMTNLNKPEMRTLPVGIASFHGQFVTDWGLVFAASVIAITPIIILFIFFQKYFVKGITAGSVKG